MEILSHFPFVFSKYSKFNANISLSGYEDAHKQLVICNIVNIFLQNLLTRRWRPHKYPVLNAAVWIFNKPCDDEG